jgi:hypothetical protein
MKMINEGNMARLEQETKHDAPEKALERLRKLTKDASEMTQEVMKKSRIDSDPLIKMRKGLAHILETAENGGRLPAYDLVNGKPFDTYIAWLETHIAQPFKVTLSNMKTALVLYHAIKTALILPDFQSGEPLLNISIEGANSSGKSFLLWLMIAIHLDGACISTNHISPHAFTTGANNSNHAVLEHEAPSDQFIDPYDKTGNGRAGDAGADPKKAGIMKSMLTEFIAASIVLQMNRETGERTKQNIISKAHNVFIQCVNWDIGNYAPAPILSRYVRIELKEKSTKEASDDLISQHRPKSTESPAILSAVTRNFKLHHGMFLCIEDLISCSAIPNVSKDYAIYMQQEVEHNLKVLPCLYIVLLREQDKLGIPPANLTRRKAQSIILLARELVLGSAAFHLMATHDGHKWLTQNGYKSPFEAGAIREFIGPKLKIEKEHFSYAATLLGFQLVDSVETDAITALAIKAKAENAAQREPLTVPRSELRGERDILASMGLIAGGPRQATLGFASPRHGTPGPGRGAPGAEAPQALASRGQSNDDGVPDYRYIVARWPSEDAAYKDLANIIYDMTASKPRTEQLGGIYRSKRDLLVESPYYEKVPDMGGIVPTARIPAMLKIDEANKHGKRAKCVFAVAVAYLQRRLGVVLAYGSHVREEVMRELHGGGDDALLDDLEREEYARLIDTPLARRLEIQTVKLEEAVQPAFVERLSQCDVLREPVAHALRLTFENSILGKMSPKSRSDFASEDNLLVYTQPRDIRVEVQLPGAGHRTVVQYLPLGWMMQQLHIVRRREIAPFVFTNGNRAKAIGRGQLDVTLAPYVASTETAAYTRWAKSHAISWRFDLDMQAALQSMEALGRGVGRSTPDEYYTDLLRHARYHEFRTLALPANLPGLDRVPHTFPPLERHLALFAWLRDKEFVSEEALIEFLKTMQFPQHNLTIEIAELVERVLGQRTGSLKGITPADTVMLRYPPPAWATEEDAMDLDDP